LTTSTKFIWADCFICKCRKTCRRHLARHKTPSWQSSEAKNVHTRKVAVTKMKEHKGRHKECKTKHRYATRTVLSKRSTIQELLSSVKAIAGLWPPPPSTYRLPPWKALRCSQRTNRHQTRPRHTIATRTICRATMKGQVGSIRAFARGVPRV